MAKRRNLNSGSKKNELDFGELNPKQTQFFASRTLYTAYGGAKGGGKTHAVRLKAIAGAVRWPGIRILIIRRTYPELQSNHIDPIIKLIPQTLGNYNGALHTMYLVNESTIHFGHYQGSTAEQEYQGQEYDWIFIDEATQFTEHEFRFLGGLLRGVNDIPKRFYLTCNPGGVGHRWVKRLFIDRQFKTDSQNPEENENPEDYTFIFATVEDNEALMKSSPQYVQMLSSLPENMRRAYRYGDWNALAGTYFPEFNRDIHVVEPFRIPAHWTRYRAFDYGLDCLAVGWFAVDEQGRCYMYRELKRSNLIVSDAAKLILSMTLPDENIAVTFAPPDMWNRQKDTGKTMAELFMVSGVGIVPANNNRVQGWLQVKEAFKVCDDGLPGLMLTENCTETAGDIEAIQADEKNPNDCAKEPHEITHAPDMLRYFCISRTMKPEQIRAAQAQYIVDDDEDMDNYDEHMTGGAMSAAYMAYGGR
jgi:phage terminase large subunit